MRKTHHVSYSNSLQVIPNPPALLSASRDKRARTWSHTGEYYGTLRQNPGGGRWFLPIDIKTRNEEELNEVKSVSLRFHFDLNTKDDGRTRYQL